MTPPLITLEDHFTLDSLWTKNKGHEKFDYFSQWIKDEMNDVDGSHRLEEMDKGKINLQVLSYMPVNLTPEEARVVNERAGPGLQTVGFLSGLYIFSDLLTLAYHIAFQIPVG